MKKSTKIAGPTKKWKRVKDQEGKPKSFGFCEYEEPEGALRALKLFSGIKLCSADLIV